MKKYNIAIVGATGNVGREMLKTLHERNFPANEVFAVASERSTGKEVSFGDNETLVTQNLEHFDFTNIDIAFFSPGASVSKIYAPKAAESGCIVIDNTSQFRMDDDVPLIIPEVNPQAIAGYTKRNIIANPNCSTIQMLVALKPLHDLAVIKRIVVSTYQSVSGAGKSAMDELYLQTKGIYEQANIAPQNFTKQIAFNAIPHIDIFMDDGNTKEEWKMIVETQKILDKNIQLSATCVRIPVFIGHGESINVEFEQAISQQEARTALENAQGVAIIDSNEDGGYITPAECVGDDLTFISRLRQDNSTNNALNMWVVSDNMRKGAALNAVQIAEELIANYL